MKFPLLLGLGMACAARTQGPAHPPLSPDDAVLLTSGLTLPRVVAGQAPVLAVAVQVERERILVDGAPVLGLTLGVVSPEELKGHVAPALYDRLLDKHRQHVLLEEQSQGSVPIEAMQLVMDESVPFETAVVVIATAGQAQWTRFQLVARNAAGTLVVVPFALPAIQAPGSASDPGTGPTRVVRLDSTGISIDDIQRFPCPEAGCVTLEDWPVTQAAAHLADPKHADGALLVAVGDSVPWAVVAQVSSLAWSARPSAGLVLGLAP